MVNIIKNLEVKNFKSIKHLKLDCKRVNIFIGRPNTGKSNILESAGIFSLSYTYLIKELIRFENTINLFRDHNYESPIKITFGDMSCEIGFRNDRFIGGGKVAKSKIIKGKLFDIDIDYNGNGNIIPSRGLISNVKFYKFQSTYIFPKKDCPFFSPPKGDNLLQMLHLHKNLQKLISELFSDFGLKIVLRTHENKIEVQKENESGMFPPQYPYSLVSDTLQRIVFYLTAIETNKNSVLIFEEPEAHAFPYYTKFLAERIALDETNQYFTSTHNPYFILSVLEKTPKKDVGIFITYFENYQTKIKPLNEKEKQKILDMGSGLFFNLDKFVPEK